MTTRIGGKGLEVPATHSDYDALFGITALDKIFEHANRRRYLLMPWPRKPQSRFEAEAMDEDIARGTAFYRVRVLIDDVPTEGAGITLAEACANALWG